MWGNDRSATVIWWAVRQLLQYRQIILFRSLRLFNRLFHVATNIRVNTARTRTAELRDIKAQAASRWFPTAAARVRDRLGHVGFMVDKVALGQVSPEYFGYPCQSSFHQILHPHNYPGQVQYANWWPTRRVDPVGLQPPTIRIKKNCCNDRNWQWGMISEWEEILSTRPKKGNQFWSTRFSVNLLQESNLFQIIYSKPEEHSEDAWCPCIIACGKFLWGTVQ
jgi:hypothetical protein